MSTVKESLIASFRNVSLDDDICSLIKRFMDSCQCLYGSPLPAIDSEFVEGEVTCEKVEEIVRRSNVKLNDVYFVTDALLTYLFDVKKLLLDNFGEDNFDNEVAYVFDYLEGWTYGNSYGYACDESIEPFLIQFPINSTCQMIR